MANTDYSYRLNRARSEKLQLVRYLDEEESTAEIYNGDSGNTYTVSLSSCTCEFFHKQNAKKKSIFSFLLKQNSRSVPCKHILFLMLTKELYDQLCVEINSNFLPSETADPDDDIPYYKDYYSGGPTGAGFCNLYAYTVSGYVHSVSKRTGKPTCRKKTVGVGATCAADATIAAESLGVLPPYSKVECHSPAPTVNQLNYLHSLHIPYPALINNRDVHALLTRYQDQDFEIAPIGLFAIATELRIIISYFASPRQLCDCIWANLPEERRPAFYCYAVYCKELDTPLESAPLPYTHTAFTSFSPDEKYFTYVLQHDGVHRISKRPKIYKFAVQHLRSHSLLS